MFVTINCKWCRSISTRSKDNFTTKTNKQISNTLVCFICKYTLAQQRFQNMCWWMVFHIIYHFITLIMYGNLEVIYRSMPYSIYQINEIRGTVILFWAIHKEKRLRKKAWRHQRGHQKPLIVDGQTMQWSKENRQKTKQWFTKQYTENKRSSNTNFTKIRGFEIFRFWHWNYKYFEYEVWLALFRVRVLIHAQTFYDVRPACIQHIYLIVTV